ncbi:uncharacterized protein LOC108459707 [Gossypium arboreum]|uniref:VOC domain-containing protein n=1 Tax=Gossypium arboreum TaxID=29729 RepID=A0ABR0PAU9_GOSAR|nr:uncharacterized protein LOC108459707 [Gossypium arboreum]KAK5818290.1 hypothetical protein PVK06_023224 [Gossypium arboreum]
MAFKFKPVFGYTVVYVENVAKSVDFYAKASGYNVRRLDESHSYYKCIYSLKNIMGCEGFNFGYRCGELESGQTTIAFTPKYQHETDKLTGAVQVPRSDSERTPMELCFVYSHVDTAYKRAVAVRQPEKKEWGQRVDYVRDIDGITVRMGSHVHPPKQA